MAKQTTDYYTCILITHSDPIQTRFFIIDNCYYNNNRDQYNNAMNEWMHDYHRMSYEVEKKCLYNILYMWKDNYPLTVNNRFWWAVVDSLLERNILLRILISIVQFSCIERLWWSTSQRRFLLNATDYPWTNDRKSAITQRTVKSTRSSIGILWKLFIKFTEQSSVYAARLARIG